MATVTVCPRCRGALQRDARACPRCGLVVGAASPDTSNGYYADTYTPRASEERGGREVAETSTASYVEPGGVLSGRTTAYAPSRVQPSHAETVRHSSSAPPESAIERDSYLVNRMVPRGAIELLPDESVVFQLGALHLTNKRVVLLAPTVVRAAFLRDVDAIGTLTERSSSASFISGLFLLLLSGASLFAALYKASFAAAIPWAYYIEPIILCILFGAGAAALLISYFFWVKRTLFVSVNGRPLITISISEWNTRKLEAMDTFLNAFFQEKDADMNREQIN